MTLRLLIATLAFAALPASAHAATLELRGDGTLLYTASAGASNDVYVNAEGPAGVRLLDTYESLKLVGSGCVQTDRGASCPTGVTRIELELGDGDDDYYSAHGLPARVDGGPGADRYVLHPDIGATASRTDFRGGPGEDTATYSSAAAAVNVSKDDVANDGRVGDGDNIHSDVERLVGSVKADTLTGNPDHGTEFDGGAGDDVLDGIGGTNVFATDEYPDGADVIRGGKGLDELDYTGRWDPVTVTVDGGAHDDGARGEGDDVTGVEWIDGGRADDTISARGSAALEAYGGGGNDTLIGGPADDYLDGEIGADTVSGGRGPDTIHAADATRDRIDCGGNKGDWVWRDKHERAADGCRTAGTLDLHATKVSMRVTWTQPGGWGNLRRLTISPVRHGWNYGEIRIDPKRKRLTATGDVTLRRGARVTRSGNRVTATFRYTLGYADGGHMYYRADALETE